MPKPLVDLFPMHSNRLRRRDADASNPAESLESLLHSLRIHCHPTPGRPFGSRCNKSTPPPSGEFLSPVGGCLEQVPPSRIATRKGFVRDADVSAGLIRPTLAKQPALGAQRRARIEVSSPAGRTLPWKLAGNEDVAVGFEL